jgi:ribosome biogenesis GTPase A
MEEITKLGISNLVKYMTPQQYEHAEKGGLLKQAGNALNTGIMNTAKSAINYASSGQITNL